LRGCAGPAPPALASLTRSRMVRPLLFV
jgi:hypothetical protein